MNEKPVIKVNIQFGDGRHDMVDALASEGYPVWVEEIREFNKDSTFFLCFINEKQGGENNE